MAIVTNKSLLTNNTFKGNMAFMSLNKRIGKNIRKQRLIRGWSQGDLARKLKVDRSYISSLESGRRNPSIGTLEKIAQTLGCAVFVLVAPSPYEAAAQSNPDNLPYVPGLIQTKEPDWQGKKWYHQRFDGSPYLLHLIAEAGIATRREQKHDLFLDRNFCFFENGQADWYFDRAEIDRITKTILLLAPTHPALGKELMNEYQPLEQLFYATGARIEGTDIKKLTDQQLMELHDHFLTTVLRRNSSSSIIDGFALGSDTLLEGRIKTAYEKLRRRKTSSSFAEVFSTVTASAHVSFVREAEIELFKLVLQIQKNYADKKQLIQNYRDQFFWIKNNYIDATELTASYFEEEIARIESSGLDVARELKNLEKIPHLNATKKATLLTELRLDSETTFLLTLTDDFTKWQDERKKATLLSAYYATILLTEIARRTNLPTELLKYLSPREVSQIFYDQPPVELLKERQKNCVVYWDAGGHEIVTGFEAAAVQRSLFTKITTDVINDFRGMTASLGKAQGRVKVIKTAKEIDRMEPGDILVAVMTRPDYVPAMKKAAAIVTDEGGITSHAAIVARELKIPCIIGTKIATHTLRDGDLVRVNADHGIVQILKRAE